MNQDKQKVFRLLPIFVAAVGLIAIIAVCIAKFLPTFRRMDAAIYFGALGENEAAVVVDDHIASERALILEGSAYIDYTLVQQELNARFHWDASEGVLLFTTAEQLFEILPNSTTYTVDGESFDAGYEILKTTSSGMFLSANFMQQYSDLRCELFDAPARIVVTRGSTQYTKATVRKDSAVRYLGGIKSPIITDVTEDTSVTVLEQMDHWSRILTPDGYIGYIKNSRLKDLEEITSETYYQGPEYTSIRQEGRVNLVWHQINYAEMNNNLASDMADVTGVNVISPTWYFLSDNNGGVDSFADASYVEEAHKAGLQVWALISNFSADISTTTILASRTARQNIQNYLVDQALELGFDGINIDFEGIAQEAAYDYVQFMRELSILCRKNQIVLSVDVPVPMDFSRYYNRQELGNVCDYVIMMGYDEHYYGSETAGSVASMDFETTGIQNMLTEVAPEKLISAIPFYSRIWYTGTNEDGSTTVTSELVTMEGAQQVLADLGVTSSYDETTGQQYAQWTAEDGRLCEIWLETDDSIAARAALVGDYELGGIAEWVLGSQDDSVWEIISSAISG
jgi:spore germination protein YaaH